MFGNWQNFALRLRREEGLLDDDRSQGGGTHGLVGVERRQWRRPRMELRAIT